MELVAALRARTGLSGAAASLGALAEQGQARRMWAAAMLRGASSGAMGAAVCRRAAGGAARPRVLASRWLSSAEAEWTVALSQDAARRIHMVSPESPLLRLGVESGGCSGFSYKFEIDNVVATDKDRCGSVRHALLEASTSLAPQPHSCMCC